jgi:type IV fimbrial biogenesis protein FimT
MKTRRTNREQGFTIIEVLTVIVMIGVLMALAAPSFVSFTSGQKVKTASFDVYAALMFARSEAIKRRQNVTVAPVSSDWRNGWTISTTIGGVDTMLRTQDPLTGVTFTGPTSVIYRLDGRLTSTGALGVLIQPQVADASIANRCIRVDLTGLPKSTTTTTTTCP